MNYDKDDFKVFCKMYEKENGFQYLDNNLTESEKGWKYAATFRDQDNYKISFELYLNDGKITWSEPDFYGDEEFDTKPLFHSVVTDVISKFNEQNPLVRIFSPIMCSPF